MLESVRWRNQAVVAVARAMLLCSPLLCQPALADTLESALAYAYANNPQINSQRAVVRATDEGVPTALNAPASYFTQSGVNTQMQPAPAGLESRLDDELRDLD